MDLRLSWKAIEKFLFSSPGILIGLFGFLAIVNAHVVRHSVEGDQIKIATIPHKPGVLEKINGHLKLRPKEEYNSKVESELELNTSMDGDTARMHKVMLSFYLGYAATHLPASLLVERYGSKWILVVGVSGTAALALATTSAVNYYGFKGFICIRLLMGMSEGPLFTALNNLIFQQLQMWHNVASYGVLLVTAAHIGILMVNLISVILMPYLEYPIVGYFLGAYTVLWFIGFQIFCYNDPDFGSNITEEERANAQPNRELSLNSFSQNSLSSSSRQWHVYLVSPSLWALICTILQHDWTQSLILTELRRLVHDLKASNMWENCCSLLKILIPFILSWLLSIMSDVLGDILVDQSILDREEAINYRALMVSFVPKICSDFVSCLLSHESNNVLTTFHCTMGVLSSCYVGIKFSCLDVNPQHSSTLMNIANDFGSLMTIMAPYMDSLPGIVSD